MAVHLRPIRSVAMRHAPSAITAMQLKHENQSTESPTILCRRHLSCSSAPYQDYIINVPRMAESISEGTIANIHKQIGDRVEEDEEFANIETDKIDVPVNAAEGGFIAELLAAEGDVVTVGQSIARIQKTPIAGAAILHEKCTKPSKEASESTPVPAPQKATESEYTMQENSAIKQASQTEPAIRANNSPASQSPQIADKLVAVNREPPLRGEREVSFQCLPALR